MNLFETRNMGVNAGDKSNEWWATFLVNVANSDERYMLSNPTDKKTADAFTEANNRLARLWRER